MRQTGFSFKLLIICLFTLLMCSGLTWATTPRSIHLSWLDQNVSDTTMVVTWLENSNLQAHVEYGLQTMSYPITVNATSHSSTNLSQLTPTFVHTAELYNLEPNTTYYYRVGYFGNMSEEKSFTTGPPVNSNQNFRFIVGSDSHATTPGTKRSRLAYQILKENIKPGFLFFGGDEITGNNGHVLPPNIIQWSKQWNKFFSPTVAKYPFTGAWAKMLEQIPYMTSDSNHVDSDDSFFDLFKYPYPFGTRRLADKPGAESGCSYKEVSPTNKRGNNGWYSFNYGNAHFIVLQINTAKWATDPRFCTWDAPPRSDQYIWLEDDLKDANADPGIRWKFAIWHSAPYSYVKDEPPLPQPPKQGIDAETAADRGLTRNLHIQDTVGVLFNKYDVDMVFSGHQHRYERSKMIINDDSTAHENKYGHGVAIDQDTLHLSTYDRTKDGKKKGVVYVVTGGMGNVEPAISLNKSNYTALQDHNSKAHFKANHYIAVDIDNAMGEAKCKVMGYMVDGTTIDFKVAPTILDDFKIVKRPNHLRVVNGETTMGTGVVERVIELNPPVVPSHAFVMVSASNSHRPHEPNQSNNKDNCGVFQVTASFEDNGKTLVIKRSGNETPPGTVNTTPLANVSYQIIQSPDIKVLHGSGKIEKLSFNKSFDIEGFPQHHSIATISSRSNANRQHYHETQIRADVNYYENQIVDSPNAELSLTRNSAGNAEVDVEWSVIRFKNNVNVQKGFLELKGNQPQEVKLLPPVDPSKSWLYFTTSGGTPVTAPNVDTNASIEDHMVRGTLTNYNTLLFSRSGISNVKYSSIQWFVVEFPKESNAYVQRGVLSPGKWNKTIAASISPQPDSFIFHSAQGAGSFYDFVRTAWVNRFTFSGTGIEFERWVDGQPGEIDWQVVKFPE